MKADLLTSLRKFKKSAKLDPVENFITEAFAWLLMKKIGQAYYQRYCRITDWYK